MTAGAIPQHLAADALVDYFEHKLSSLQEAEIEKHIADCNMCADLARRVNSFSYIWDQWTAKAHAAALLRAHEPAAAQQVPSAEKIEEATLVERAISGDVESLCELYRRYKRSLILRLRFRFNLSLERAEELLHDSFVEMVSKGRGSRASWNRAEGEFGNWLMGQLQTNMRQLHRRVGFAQSQGVMAAPLNESHPAYIRTLIGDLARKVGFPDGEVAKIEMAVDEACSNIVEHAYAGKKKADAAQKTWQWKHRDPEIQLDVRAERDRLVIEINDCGQRFDFTSYRPKELGEHISPMETGCYGIAIMREFMDEVQYSSSDADGNTLRLVKYLRKSSSNSPAAAADSSQAAQSSGGMSGRDTGS